MKMDALVDNDIRKSQSEINKSMEGNQNHSGSLCQINTPNVKENAIRINWPKANDDRWKALDEELSFILQNSLKVVSLGLYEKFLVLCQLVCRESFSVLCHLVWRESFSVLCQLVIWESFSVLCQLVYMESFRFCVTWSIG